MLAVLAAASTGCALLNSGRNAFSETARLVRPKPYDTPMNHDEDDDKWGFVGDEGRADQPRERDPDRWWQNLIMSQEARNIERNLGID